MKNIKKVKKNMATPLYLQLKNIIKRDIKSGVLKAGDQIPSESEMQNMYNMSRVTIRNALAELEIEGYIQKVQGKGSFVTESDIRRLPDGIVSFSEEAKLQGVEITADIIVQKVMNTVSELDKKLFDLTDTDRVFVLKRIRKANGVPVTIEENHFPERFFSLQDDDLTGSLYDVLKKKYKIIPSIKGMRSVRIGFATEEVAKCLNLSLGTPVIESDVCVYEANGLPIHSVKDIVRGDIDRYVTWYV